MQSASREFKHRFGVAISVVIVAPVGTGMFGEEPPARAGPSRLLPPPNSHSHSLLLLGRNSAFLLT